MSPTFTANCSDGHCYTAWTSEPRTNTTFHLVRRCTLCGDVQEEGTWVS